MNVKDNFFYHSNVASWEMDVKTLLWDAMMLGQTYTPHSCIVSKDYCPLYELYVFVNNHKDDNNDNWNSDNDNLIFQIVEFSENYDGFFGVGLHTCDVL